MNKEDVGQNWGRNYNPYSPDAPVRDGYDFKGWYADADCTEYVGSLLDKADEEGNVTLYAGWNEVI